MNSRMDEIHEFVKTNIPATIDNKKGKSLFSMTYKVPHYAVVPHQLEIKGSTSILKVHRQAIITF